ncbi:MAG TPA: DNA mismatch endonuclease Vsr [Saprospiraceae bacterium]|nr:DNA mismatch endonuclease Vsr [Saprospiraceae bacterium]HRP42830.1 DNA mismatch endonuclease Vsr [Saprospiraceae bacterium]
MTDVHNKTTRSYNMSRIRAKDTKPELLVRKFLFANGLRYRLHNTKLPGKPDITLGKYHTVIFVNGCFWHGHQSCKYFVLPKTRSEWWKNKIKDTNARDRKSLEELKELGWNTMIVWECELKPDKRASTLYHLLEHITRKNN